MTDPDAWVCIHAIADPVGREVASAVYGPYHSMAELAELEGQRTCGCQKYPAPFFIEQEPVKRHREALARQHDGLH